MADRVSLERVHLQWGQCQLVWGMSENVWSRVYCCRVLLWFVISKGASSLKCGLPIPLECL